MVQFGGRVCYHLRPWLVAARASLRHKSMRHCTRAVLPTERHNTPTAFLVLIQSQQSGNRDNPEKTRSGRCHPDYIDTILLLEIWGRTHQYNRIGWKIGRKNVRRLRRDGVSRATSN